jgi:hypothetical protein
MDTPTLTTFRKLSCACGGETFYKIVGLAWRAGAGTTETAKGYACHSCHVTVDMAAMQQRQELAQLEAEIQERRARVQALSPVTP